MCVASRLYRREPASEDGVQQHMTHQTIHPSAVPAGSFDGTVIMWDVGTATAVHTLKGHQYQVTSIAVLPSGDVASASVDK